MYSAEEAGPWGGCNVPYKCLARPQGCRSCQQWPHAGHSQNLDSQLRYLLRREGNNTWGEGGEAMACNGSWEMYRMINLGNGRREGTILLHWSIWWCFFFLERKWPEQIKALSYQRSQCQCLSKAARDFSPTKIHPSKDFFLSFSLTLPSSVHVCTHSQPLIYTGDH